MTIRKHVQNQVDKVPFQSDLTKIEPWASDSFSHTDLPRLKKGQVGAQFWSSYVDCNSQYKDAVIQFQEQIDVIHQLCNQYPSFLSWAVTASDIETAFKEGRIASLVGVEGGHSLDSSLAVLRAVYTLGARYMTLTHTCDTPWAEAEPQEAGMKGLSKFGERVVKEMNRLGMMVDLSHVSRFTMEDALRVSTSPVIFSHSGARAVFNHSRNVPDSILEELPWNGGVVMVTFYSCHVTDCESRSGTLADVVKHIDHIRSVAGVEHVGLGGDFNGVDKFPEGIQDVSSYPNVLAALIELSIYDWDDSSLALLAGGNLLRVFKEVESHAERGNRVGDNTWLGGTQEGVCRS